MLKIDAHAHFSVLDSGKTLEDIYQRMLLDMEQNGIDRFAVLVPERLGEKSHLYAMEEALWLKRLHPDKVYVFGGLRFPEDKKQWSSGLVKAVDELIAFGCDGIKLLFAKPDSRKNLGERIDSEYFRALFARLEESRLPIVWHVSDPLDFWDKDKVPLWARQNRWWYDASCPKDEQIREEVNNVIERHPSLKLILAHFFFMSHDLKEAGNFLAAHPNVYFDLAPGIEMYHDFTEKASQARDFFIEYADRIIYGSDAGMDAHATSLNRAKMIQKFLETDEVIMVPEDDPCMMPDAKDRIRGIALPPPVLKKIYSGNFLRLLKTA